MKIIQSIAEAQAVVDNFNEWHHAFEIYPGVKTPGNYAPERLFEMLELPASLSGYRVLDVGASNGYYSRELDRRGADVVALDYRTKSRAGFDIMEACFGKEIRHVNANISEAGKLGLGTFDIVLCLGVIYHLPDPVKALWDLRQLCGAELYVETYVEHFDDARPAARYYPGASLGNDFTNFWAYNIPCVHAMLEDAGFSVVRTKPFENSRLLVHARVREGVNVKMQTAYGLVFERPA